MILRAGYRVIYSTYQLERYRLEQNQKSRMPHFSNAILRSNSDLFFVIADDGFELFHDVLVLHSCWRWIHWEKGYARKMEADFFGTRTAAHR